MTGIKELIESVKYTPLSFDELNQLSKKHYGRPMKVVNYQELIQNPKSLHELFGHHKSIILYYPNMDTNEGLMGHFIAMVKSPDTVYFFDPYGDRIDSQKPTGDPQNLYNERQNTLIKMLLESGYNVDYSDHKLQNKKNPKIATCGRWSVWRANHPEMDNDEFAKLVKGLTRKYKMKYDDLVSLLIN